MSKITLFLLLSLLTQLLGISASGHAFLEGETDHTDIEVNFRKTWPELAYSGPSVYTDSTGYYTIYLANYVATYEITFSKTGYYTQQFSKYFSASGTVENVTLEKKTGISDLQLPEKTALYQNYPNPFNPTTTINYDLSENAQVELNVYNQDGQLVSSLVNDLKNRGSHKAEFNANGLTSGIYIYKLKVNDKVFLSRKMMLLK